MDPDEVIDALAATRHGVVTRSQLLAAGLSARQIDRRLASHRLRRIYSGVYLVRGHPPTFMARLSAAVLAAGPSAAASYRAAGFLHGLSGVEACFEITTDLRRAPALPGVVVHRSSDLGPRDIEDREVVARTRVARTLVDLAAVVSTELLGEALDDALCRRLVTCRYLSRRLDQVGRQGRKGAGALALLLEDRIGGRRQPESRFERLLFSLLADAGLPLPIPQFEVLLPDGRMARLDFAYPEQLLALEADSYRHHSSKRDWARDHTRNRLLTSLGWRILPVTWDDLSMSSTPLLAVVARGLCIALPLAG